MAEKGKGEKNRSDFASRSVTGSF